MTHQDIFQPNDFIDYWKKVLLTRALRTMVKEHIYGMVKKLRKKDYSN